MTRILVAGIGNIFMGDDGFGCEVARRLRGETAPDGADVIDVVDFGIRGVDLHYALEDSYDLVILVDAVERGGEPGTLHVIEPSPDAGLPPVPPSPHGMDPATVLQLAAGMGKRAPRVLLVACEPEWLGGDEGHMGLSETVTATVDAAVDEVRSLLRDAMHAPCTRNADRPLQRNVEWQRAEGAGRLREEGT